VRKNPPTLVRLFVLVSLCGCIGSCKKFQKSHPQQAEPQSAEDACTGRDLSPWPWRSLEQGKWGEDPRLVPDFGYRQERRAPKMPDAGRYLSALGAATKTALADALLICHVETYPRIGSAPFWYKYKLGQPNPNRRICQTDWDPLNGPDVLLRFRFRDEYPISLFGPEDHWGFFISIPRVRLGIGEQLAVKLWDRDFADDDEHGQYMGEAQLRFDGTLPFLLRSEFFTMRCSAMDSERALAAAQGNLEALDRSLSQALAWHPDPGSWNLGANLDAEHAKSEYGSGIFRYAAGFLGWDHPEIQRRLKLYDEIVRRDQQSRRELASALLRQAAPALGAKLASAGLGTLQVTSAECTVKGCTAELRAENALLKELCASVSSGRRALIAGIDAQGSFSNVNLEFPDEGKWQSCHALRLPGEVSTVRATLQSGAVLLWLALGKEKAIALRLPPPRP